jgi:hypothetical protein
MRRNRNFPLESGIEAGRASSLTAPIFFASPSDPETKQEKWP